jgi:hypothetical protein
MRKLPSIAAFFESAEWKSRIGADIIVDEYRAALDFGSDAFTARNIARDHTAAQSEEIFRKARLLKARGGLRQEAVLVCR